MPTRFPVPDVTYKIKADMARCAEDMLLAREALWLPSPLYSPCTQGRGVGGEGLGRVRFSVWKRLVLARV